MNNCMMDTLILINSIILGFSISGILLVIIVYPLSIWMLYLIIGKKTLNRHTAIDLPISLITVVHNGGNLIVDKIKNYLSLNYPSENYEIIIFSDGSTDNTANKVKPFIDKNIKFFSFATHRGKSKAINEVIQNCSGEIIVFSDADAILDSDSILNITKYFALPEIGGVCGQRIIYKDNNKLTNVQSDYISFDSIIKKLESRLGNISSNDGKLYAIKRELFLPIPPAVTDDLYVCLSIAKQNYRFVFEPEAKAFIKVPSRGSGHEVERRRRVVSTSLRGIWLLNPFKYGLFSLSIIINKIIRRLYPSACSLCLSVVCFYPFII